MAELPCPICGCHCNQHVLITTEDYRLIVKANNHEEAIQFALTRLEANPPTTVQEANALFQQWFIEDGGKEPIPGEGFPPGTLLLWNRREE